MAVVRNLMVRSGADFSHLYREMNKAQKKLNVFKQAAGTAMKGLGVIFGGVAIGKLVKGTISTAMRTETLDVALQSVARSSGYAIAALQEQRKAVMGLGIAEQEASQILTRFMQAQLDTADAAKVSRVAQDAAVVAGENSSDTALKMTEAIAKQRPELLAAYGMTRNLNAIYDDYSKTLGKTRAQLNEAEQKQAILNYILAEGEKIAGTYEASMGSVGKQIGSLPRYWQTLQNAIAKPLALPGMSVAVQAITDALKGAISWTEANTVTLQRWGQTAAGVLSAAIRGFQLVTKVIAQNWGVIRFATTALLSYAVATRAVSAATAAWRTVSLALQGSLMQKIPLLSLVSAAVGGYRVQIALAPAATNKFTLALYKLQAALHAVHVAMGPIGWAILGISVAVGIGSSLWGKYGQSLDKTNQSLKDLGNLTASQGKSATKAAGAIEDQADAIDKAGKAAKGSLQGFDEINQMQEDTAAGGGLDLPDDLDLESLDAGLPVIDFEELAGGIEQVKPTLGGFFAWIGEQMGNIWAGIKGKWLAFTTWVSGTWAGPLLQGIGSVFSAVGSIVGYALSGLASIASKLWQNVLVPLGKFIGGILVGVFNGLVAVAQWLWQYVLAPLGSFIASVLVGVFNVLITVTTWLWQNVLVPLGRFILDTLVPILGAVASAVGLVFMAAIEALIKALEFLWHDVLKPIGVWLGDTFGPVFETVGEGIKEVIEGLQTTFDGLIKFITGVFTGDWRKAWEGVKQIFKGVFDSLWGIVKVPLNLIIDGINWVIGGLNKLKITIPDWVKYVPGLSGLSGKSWGINIAKIPRLAEGAITNGPMLAVVGDNPGGREVVSPLDTLTDMIVSAVAEVGGGGGGASNINLIVRIGEDTIVDKVISSINRNSRISGETVITV